MRESEYIRTGPEILESSAGQNIRSNKGTYGKILCIAGSMHMAGGGIPVCVGGIQDRSRTGKGADTEGEPGHPSEPAAGGSSYDF